MAQKILIMGESGTGKSTSLRNCDPATTAVVNPVGKPLPFKGKFTMLNSETEARKICKWMKEQAAAGKKLLVVDDFQYILAVPYIFERFGKVFPHKTVRAGNKYIHPLLLEIKIKTYII